jgi:hypothetical protein
LINAAGRFYAEFDKAVIIDEVHGFSEGVPAIVES